MASCIDHYLYNRPTWALQSYFHDHLFMTYQNNMYLSMFQYNQFLYLCTYSRHRQREGLYFYDVILQGSQVHGLMLEAAVHPVRVSYVYRFVTLSIFQFFYWTISPVMSDCLLQILHRFYYVRVVPMVYYAILVTIFAVRDCCF